MNNYKNVQYYLCVIFFIKEVLLLNYNTCNAKQISQKGHRNSKKYYLKGSMSPTVNIYMILNMGTTQ